LGWTTSFSARPRLPNESGGCPWWANDIFVPQIYNFKEKNNIYI
jgi:hypothetical protein